MSEHPFKNREDVKKEIKMCDRASGIITIASLIFAALGVISDALDVNLVLESMSWFLLAILAGMGALMPFLNQAVATHLYGIESEIKKQE
jgi:Mg2+/citrate symporter